MGIGMDRAYTEPLDQEWIDLILEALELGIKVDEIQQYLVENGNR